MNCKSGIILALLFAVIFSLDCGGNPKTSSANNSDSSAGNANAVKTNVEELNVLINVPYEAEDIAWKQDTQKHIVAVLKFSTENANRCVQDAEKFGPGQNVTVTEQSWFPDELTAQAELSGNDTLKGISYPANAFFMEPYNSGRIARVEGGDYFVLELSSK